MGNQKESISVNHIPVRHNITPVYIFSILIVIGMSTASAVGLFFPSSIYSTEDSLQSFFVNDILNLCIGVPILLGSMWITRRGRWLGLLLWPGALFYVLYNYIAYIFGMQFNVLYLLYLFLVITSFYALIYLVASIDGKVVKKQLSSRVPERLTGGILTAFGILFLVRASAIILNGAYNNEPVSGTELPVLIADLLTAPARIMGGALLWKRKELGYVSGAGLLFQASMLFFALILFLVLQPPILNTPFVIGDVLFVFFIGIICFLPFGLYVRGITTWEIMK